MILEVISENYFESKPKLLSETNRWQNEFTKKPSKQKQTEKVSTQSL